MKHVLGILSMISMASFAYAVDSSGYNQNQHSSLSFKQLQESCSNPGQFNRQIAPNNIHIECRSLEKTWEPMVSTMHAKPTKRYISATVRSSKYDVAETTAEVNSNKFDYSCPQLKEVERTFAVERDLTCDDILSFGGSIESLCQGILDQEASANAKIISSKDTGIILGGCLGQKSTKGASLAQEEMAMMYEGTAIGQQQGQAQGQSQVQGQKQGQAQAQGQSQVQGQKQGQAQAQGQSQVQGQKQSQAQASQTQQSQVQGQKQSQAQASQTQQSQIQGQKQSQAQASQTQQSQVQGQKQSQAQASQSQQSQAQGQKQSQMQGQSQSQSQAQAPQKQGQKQSQMQGQSQSQSQSQAQVPQKQGQKQGQAQSQSQSQAQVPQKQKP